MPGAWWLMPLCGRTVRAQEEIRHGPITGRSWEDQRPRAPCGLGIDPHSRSAVARALTAALVFGAVDRVGEQITARIRSYQPNRSRQTSTSPAWLVTRSVGMTGARRDAQNQEPVNQQASIPSPPQMPAMSIPPQGGWACWADVRTTCVEPSGAEQSGEQGSELVYARGTVIWRGTPLLSVRLASSGNRGRLCLPTQSPWGHRRPRQSETQRAMSRMGSCSCRRIMRLLTQLGAWSGSRVISRVRSSNTVSTLRASMRARGAPTQWWMPRPNDRW